MYCVDLAMRGVWVLGYLNTVVQVNKYRQDKSTARLRASSFEPDSECFTDEVSFVAYA